MSNLDCKRPTLNTPWPSEPHVAPRSADCTDNRSTTKKWHLFPDLSDGMLGANHTRNKTANGVARHDAMPMVIKARHAMWLGANGVQDKVIGQIERVSWRHCMRNTSIRGCFPAHGQHAIPHTLTPSRASAPTLPPKSRGDDGMAVGVPLATSRYTIIPAMSLKWSHFGGIWPPTHLAESRTSRAPMASIGEPKHES